MTTHTRHRWSSSLSHMRGVTPAQDGTVGTKSYRRRVREVSGMALAAAFRSAMVKPFCTIRHESRFVRLLQRPSVHHGIVQTGRMLQCPS